MNPVLSIIIVNYNTKELIKQCLESVIRNDKRLELKGRVIDPKDEETIPAEIIVVDNNSTDGSREYLKSMTKKINLRLILNKKNLGFSKANNQGMEKARGEYLLLLNSDTIIPEGAISQTLLWLASRPEAAVVGCKLINPDGSPQPSVGNFPDLVTVFLMLFKEHFTGSQRTRRTGSKIAEVDWVMGAFLMFRRYLIEEAGKLDERIFMYMEEIEWCYRIKKKGYKIFFYPNAKVVHLGGGSSITGRTDPILNIYKGLVYFYQKHRSGLELELLKLMLRAKAALSWLLGVITNNSYLKRTYGQAFKLV